MIMKKTLDLIKVLLIGITPLVIFIAVSEFSGFNEWRFTTLIFNLSLLFALEIRSVQLGRRPFWLVISRKDKIIFSVGLTLMGILISLPQYIGIELLWANLFFFLLGCFVFYIFVKLFGSETMQMKLW